MSSKTHLKIAFDLSDSMRIRISQPEVSEELFALLDKPFKSGRITIESHPEWTTSIDHECLHLGHNKGGKDDRTLDFSSRMERDKAVDAWKDAFSELREMYELQLNPPAENFTVEF